MKNHTYLKLFFIIIGLLIYNLSLAQSDYIVLAKGDTIKGKVKYLNFTNAKSVQITPDGGKKKVYSLMQTKAFFSAGENYVNIRSNDGYAFMKLLKSGYLSYYAYQLPNQNNWDGRYLQKKDGSGVDLPNIGFKKILSKFLSDCEEVSKSIEAKELTKSKLDLIIDEYNNCVATRSQVKSIMPVSVIETADIDRWKELENAIKQSPLFDAKENALEIVNDIKLKILRNEKVSNFLINGLKESLANQSQLKSALDAALETLPAKQ